MTSFRHKPHAITPGKDMIEVWEGGEFIAAIYPMEGGVRIVSKGFDGRTAEDLATLIPDGLSQATCLAVHVK